MGVESVTDKLNKLIHDLRHARLVTEKRPHAGHYLGVGATVRIPSKRGLRRVSMYGSDIPEGILVNFFENGRIIAGASSIYHSTGKRVVLHHDSFRAPKLSIPTLRTSREFHRPELYFNKHKTIARVSRSELVFLDDSLRHAISQAATYQKVDHYSKIKILPQSDIRLPIRDFNKRLPNHSNAFRMWLEHRDPRLPPESQRLRSGLIYKLHHVRGDEYEGGVAVSIAGAIDELANPKIHPDGPLLRMHSACSFSERGRRKKYTNNLEKDAAYCRTLGLNQHQFVPFIEKPSETCDCRQQMEESQRIIAKEGGIFADFYEQEGRGYGLLNKEEFFYRLYEEEGWDTAEVCERYGINPDIRIYDNFVSWLLSLGIRRVRLLGNNPRKRRALEKAGIKVTTIGLFMPTKGNLSYLKTKRDRLDHDIPPDYELEQYMRDQMR